MASYRTKVYLPNGDWTRRDPQTGPYGIFIRNSTGKSTVASENLRHDYDSEWQEATEAMIALLWGSRRERVNAQEEIKRRNRRIREMNVTFNRNESIGLIDFQDWKQAGKQLDLAIRDYYVYKSDARFYDVEDFIWERMKNRHYPDAWKVEWNRYLDEIESREMQYIGHISQGSIPTARAAASTRRSVVERSIPRRSTSSSGPSRSRRTSRRTSRQYQPYPSSTRRFTGEQQISVIR